jgi:O-antigen ligase
MLFAFSLPISRAGINVFSFMLLVLWVLEGNFKEKFKIILQVPITKALLIFLSYMMIVHFWVDPKNQYEAYKYDIKFLYLLLVFIFTSSFDHKKIIYLIYAFFIGLSITLFQSLSIYFHIYPFHEVSMGSLSPHMWHTIYSIFLAFSALVALIFSIFSKNRSFFYRAIFFLIFLISTVVMFLGVARTGEIILIISIFYIFVTNRVKLRYIVAVALVICIALFGFYKANSHFKERVDLVKSDINSMFENKRFCNSLGGRVFTWKVAGEVFQKEPILGLGTVDHTKYLDYRMNSDPSFKNCFLKNMIGYYHSQYIETLSQSGLIGLMALFYLFISLFKMKIKDTKIEWIKQIVILVFLLSFFLDVPFRKMFLMALFSFFISIVAVIYKQENFKNNLSQKEK